MKNYRQIMDLDNMTVEDYQQVNRINYLAAIINDEINNIYYKTNKKR